MRQVSLVLTLIGLTACGGFPDTADSSDPGTRDPGSDTASDSADPGTASDTAGPGDVPWVVINELMAANDTVLADPAGEYDDWLELLNPSSAPFDLSGYGLTDSTSASWTFPSGTTLAPGAHLLVWCDGDLTQAGVHVDFQLAKSGETVTLLDPAGDVADQVAFPAQSADAAWGRFPDASEAWGSVTPTPGAANTP